MRVSRQVASLLSDEGFEFAKGYALLRTRCFLAGRGFDLHQRSAGVHLHVRHRHHFSNFAGKWRDYLRLHFHGFEHR